MEMARAMLKEKDLSRSFWAEAIYTVLPTEVVQNNTSIESWNGQKPSTKHIRVFGCVCYAHIPD